MLILAGGNAFAQLSDFTLTVTATDETCVGNGTLHFETAGTQPGAVITFSVYELPDTVNAIAVQTGTDLGGRTHGDYLVIATQSLNGNSGTQQQTISIQNEIVTLAYDISSTPSFCNDGTMTVIPTSGTAVQFEVISGPVTLPLQSSPTFTGLPPGVYQVRTFDVCGTGWVVTHTVSSGAAGLLIGNGSVADGALPDCSHVTVTNQLAPLGSSGISYPLSLTFTVHPPGGGLSAVIPKTIVTGPADGISAEASIPMYYDQDYSYDLSVTDACGNTYQLTGILIHPVLSVGIAALPAKCGRRYLEIQPVTYGAPFQITFTSFPAGFDPAAANPQHPGPFTAAPVDYGDSDNPVPWGTYHIRLDDGCGHSAENEITIQYHPVDPYAEITPYPGCQSNTSLVKVKLPEFEIVTAIITSAPTAYGVFPNDVSDHISAEDGVVLDPLPTGNYHIHLVDECGNEYEYDFFVPDTATSISKLARPDCTPGFGSLRLRGNSVTMTSLIMTAAADGYNTAVPHDFTAQITLSGSFSLNALPPGDYTFEIDDSCGLSHTETVTVPAYGTTSSSQTVTPHCGSFDLALANVSSSNGQDSFWLQKLDAATGQWSHPATGIHYPEGTQPTAFNSLALQNNATNLDLTFIGHFRILKYFQAFGSSPQSETVDCITPLGEFDYTGSFNITGFEKVTCSGATADVRVLTNGVPPVTYKITKKNGVDFPIDNGSNDIFTGLDPAVYDFQATDACNNIATGQTDVAQLPSIAQAHQPQDLVLCDDISKDGQETFDLSQQDSAVLGGQDPAQYVVSYHLTAADAATGDNALPLQFTTGSATVYARLLYLGNNTCFDTTQFNLVVVPYPVPQMSPDWGLCQGNVTTVTAPPGFDDYLWSTGQHGQSVVISQAGSYTLTVSIDGCTGVFPFTVSESNTATIDGFEIHDWTDDHNSITVHLEPSSIGQYEYSIDGEQWQDSPVFSGLAAGSYTVYVRDKGGCGTVSEEVFLLNYPKFFTPNGDGFNDFWRVKYSEREPHLMTYIFDRYGKLITGFLPDSPGWDGRYNGEPLPSTDYWFLVIREDGRQLRGHFAMKR
jgi:gliding motility-associated-like protein